MLSTTSPESSPPLDLFVTVVKVIDLPHMIIVEERLPVRRVPLGCLVRCRHDLVVSTRIFVRCSVRR
jgi:hypothetical protein